jgi:RNA polymerase sigma-70 factor (ECF subfamily)
VTRIEDTSDAALVVAVGRYNRDALAEIYRRHAGAVFGLARRVLVEQSLAEEVVQEVFLALWRRPERFDPDRGSLRSYLLAVAHGRSVDLVRAESSRARREEREGRLRAESGYDVEREVLDMAMAERIREALSTLRDEERRPIELAYFSGHTYREVARIQGEAEGTVKTRIRMGLNHIRAVLQEAGINEF